MQLVETLGKDQNPTLKIQGKIKDQESNKQLKLSGLGLEHWNLNFP